MAAIKLTAAIPKAPANRADSAKLPYFGFRSFHSTVGTATHDQSRILTPQSLPGSKAVIVNVVVAFSSKLLPPEQV
mgnify:CR=1 FL=1